MPLKNNYTDLLEQQIMAECDKQSDELLWQKLMISIEAQSSVLKQQNTCDYNYFAKWTHFGVRLVKKKQWLLLYFEITG